MADSKDGCNWHYDMTREEAEQMQAAELLYYKKRQLQQSVEKRTADRVAAIAATGDSALDPSWGAIVEAGLPAKNKLPLDIQLDADMLSVKQEVLDLTSAPSPSATATATVPSPPMQQLDMTHLHCDYQSQLQHKCVMSKNRKRQSTPVTNVSAKRLSTPEVATPATACVLPVALPVPTYDPQKPVPATITQLWNKIDLPGRPYDVTPCGCARCPYTTGPPLLQRWNLMVALVRLENYLWFGR